MYAGEHLEPFRNFRFTPRMAAPTHDALATTVYVGGLARGTTSDALAAAFASHIAVVHAVAVRTFGFVTFAEAESAKRAAELDIVIDGRKVHAALSHKRYEGSHSQHADQPAASRRAPSGSASCFVRIPNTRRQQTAAAVQSELLATCAAHTSSPPRVHVPRRQGSEKHRGFAFVQCAGAADAAALLAALSASSEWEAEMVRKKRGGGKARGRRGGRRGGGGRSRPGKQAAAAGSAQDDQPYDEDFESDEDPLQDLEAADEAEGGAGGSETSEADDACVEAMASFVSESREWALGVQGFLVEHCRDFDGREENKLEWFELHSALTSRMERLLEAELAKLGVPVGDFVARLESSPESKAASELVETVLAMDDFVRFKSMMIKLRADLERALQPIEQDFNVRFAR